MSITNSHLAAEEPLVGQEDEEEGFTRELIQVQWRPGDPIDLFVIKPAGIAKPPAILYLYSYPAKEDRYWDDDFCRMVTKDGFAAVGFMSALDGQRYHDVPMKEWFVSDLPQTLVATAHDVQMVLNYLEERGDLDMEHVGMFGDGSGASIAILAAAVDPRIKAVDLLNPWGDWPEWMAKSNLVPDNERPDFLKPEFLKQVAPFDPVIWLPKVKSKAVRLQVIADVAVTPQAAKEKLVAAAPANTKIVRYDTSHQFFTEAGLGGKVFDWLHQQIGPGPEYRAKGDPQKESPQPASKTER